MRTRAIIVGTDGTDTSRAAVDWAAREAQRRHLPLRIMHTYEWESGEAYYGIGNEYLEVNRSHAEAVTAAAADQARTLAPEIEIDRDTVIGYPSTQLLDASQDAELIVLGSRGRGGFAGLRLGSVSQRVATHATCPVVVVPGSNHVSDGHGLLAGAFLGSAGLQLLHHANCPVYIARHRPAAGAQ